MAVRALPATRSTTGWRAAVIGWIMVLVVTVGMLLGWNDQPKSWMLDWHVYMGGAWDLADRSLYRVPLEAGGASLPVHTYNLPPLSAALAMPFAWLPGGGIIWTLIGTAAMAVGAVLIADMLHVSRAWGGVGFGLYALWPVYGHSVILANINPIVFGLVVGFAWLHLRGEQRWAGIALGLAVALKAWPVVLLVPVIRERRWIELRWAGAVIAVQGLVFLAWLGPDIVGPMVAAVTLHVPIAQSPVLLVSQIRESVEWWPSWGGYAVCAAILVVPARGRLGVGLGIMAGLCAIPNLWTHYAPTLIVALALIVAEILRELAARRAARLTSRSSESASPRHRRTHRGSESW